MTFFLAERYVGKCTPLAVRDQTERLCTASHKLTTQGASAQLMTTTLVPADETCFWLIEAPTIAAVRLLAERAAVPFERIVEAIPIEQ